MSPMLSFRVSEADLARVDELARLNGVSRSEYLRGLIAGSIWRPAVIAPKGFVTADYSGSCSTCGLKVRLEHTVHFEDAS